jgi:hypothetical protein
MASEVNRMQFIIRTALSGVRTSMPVQVVSVTNSGGVSPIGYVSVQPLVSALDGNLQPWEHAVVSNVPYMRIQGGSNGIILDPVVGDIGIATVCDRDITAVKSAKKVSAPGSNRKNDMSDMVYLMTIIGAAPTQYVQFNSSGITINSPNTVRIQANDVQVHASHSYSWDVNGYGERWTWTGGSNWTHTTWFTGATITTINNSISPPAIP